jgi:hypothetical protein
MKRTSTAGKPARIEAITVAWMSEFSIEPLWSTQRMIVQGMRRFFRATKCSRSAMTALRSGL